MFSHKTNCICLALFLALFKYAAHAQIQADFSANITAGCAPLVIQFANTTTGSANTWFWDFGNGNSSGLKTPAAIYGKPGIFSVILIATDTATGESDTLRKNGYIIVFAPPIANFSADVSSGCAPFTVSFTDLSVPASSSITEWYWDFGDGNKSTLKNPSHTYTEAGEFTVYFIVRDANGCQDVFFMEKHIKVSKVAAGFNAPASACFSFPSVNFTNTSTGTGLNYSWDFDDGNNSTQQHPSHTFPSAIDSYSVRLIATDAKGCRDTFVQKLHVTDMVADFNYTVSCADDTSGNTFTMIFSDKTNPPPVSWYWDFGDGDTAMRANPVHQFDSLKAYPVQLIVGDGKGCIDTIIKIYQPPVAGAVADTSFSCTDLLTVNFNNVSLGTDSLSYFWDFDDGTVSPDTNQLHTFFVPDSIDVDSFFIRLTIQNKFGCVDSFRDTVTFFKPIGEFYSDVDEGCITLPVKFTSLPVSLQPIVNTDWDFGDGTTGNGTDTTHTYTQHGKYTVSMIITNQLGCKDTVIKPEFIRAGVRPDSINFDATPYDIIDNYFYDTICHHRLDSFTAKVFFSDTSMEANTWFWNFHANPSKGLFYRFTPCEDSGFMEVHTYCATIPNPVHDYDEYGMSVDTLYIDGTEMRAVYNLNAFGPDTVALIAGYNGCNDTLYKPIFIYPPTAMPGYVYPLSTFQSSGYSLASCESPATFGFYNGSLMWDSLLLYTITHVQSGEAFELDSLNWPLDSDTVYNGDTVESSFILLDKVDSSSTAFIQFNKAGNYVIEISVKNDTTRCIDVRNRMLTIDSVVKGFRATPKNTCLADNKISFEDTTTSFFGKPYLWIWDFGDGDVLTNGERALIDSFSFFYCSAHSPFSHKECPLGYEGDSVISEKDTSINHNGRTSGTYINPVHIYRDTGVYIVKSTVAIEVPYRINSSSNFNYLYCYHTSFDTVSIEGLRTDFTAGILPGCQGDTFNFTDLSYSTASISGWQWDFGDTASGAGNFSNQKNPQHIYARTGNYAVTLSIQDIIGCTDTIQKSYQVNISKPYAEFSLPDSICLGDTLTVINSSAGDSIFSVWQFESGTAPDTALAPRYLYSDTGAYPVMLVVTDKNGCMDTMSNAVAVLGIPMANFGADTILADCQPLIVNFRDSSVGIVSSYLWNFGDSSASTAENPTHIYTASDSFDVTLTVANAIGCKTSVTKSAFVVINGPYGTFEAVQDTLCYPDSVTFISQTYNAAYYFWDFGDGTLEAMRPSEIKDTLTHLYEFAGIYSPALLLYNSNQQCPFSVPSKLKIFSQKITAGFNPAILFFCTLDTIDFFNTSSSLFPIIEYKWVWGDGASDSSGNNFIQHYYGSTGTYDIDFFVRDIYGCTDTVSKPVTVNEQPLVQVHPSDTIGCVPLMITFMANSQITNLPDSLWSWDFGDGTKGGGDTIFHSFTKEGYFTVNLNITYGEGGCLVDSSFVVESVAIPDVQFEVLPLNQSCLVNSRFYFKNNTQNAVSYLWQFGNDSISLSENPDYLYPDSGKYIVKLIAYNKLGCPDSSMLNLVAYDNSVFFTAPNVFTPFPVSPGQNDVFEIPGLPGNSSIKIYNRWGEKVFEEDPYQNKWDGRDMRTRQPLEAGVYYYVLNFCGEKVITGYVHILQESGE